MEYLIIIDITHGEVIRYKASNYKHLPKKGDIIIAPGGRRVVARLEYDYVRGAINVITTKEVI